MLLTYGHYTSSKAYVKRNADNLFLGRAPGQGRARAGRGPADIGLARAGGVTINILPRNVDSYYRILQCHTPYGIGTAEGRALGRV